MIAGAGTVTVDLDPDAVRDHVPRARGTSRRRGRSSCRSRSRGTRARGRCSSPGSIPTARSTTPTAASSACSSARSPPASANARALRGGAAARRGAGRDRSREDGVLLQRQPRVPHAADADARPARGRARRRGGALDAREQLETVHRNALRLLKLVNTLLDFSRIEAGRAAGAPTSRPTWRRSPPISRARSARRSSAPALRFDVDCPPLPEPVFVDRDMWEKIVLNLLSNAFKFTLDGRDSRRAARRRRTARVLTVRDTGIGIPADELPRVFERFHRVEGTRVAHARRLGHRPRAGAGAREAARRRDRRSRARLGSRHHVHGVASRCGRAHLDPARIGTAWARRVEARRLQRLRRRGAALARRPGRNAERRAHRGGVRRVPTRARASSSPTTTPTCATTSGACSAAAGASRRSRDGRAALAAVRRPSARPRPHRRDDAGARRLRAAARAARRRGDARHPGHHALGARRRGGARSRGCRRGADDYLVKPFSARELLARVETQLLRARHARGRGACSAAQLANVFDAGAGRRSPSCAARTTSSSSPIPAYLRAHRATGRSSASRSARRCPSWPGRAIFELLDRVLHEPASRTSAGRCALMVERATGGALEEALLRLRLPADARRRPARSTASSVVAFDVTELARAAPRGRSRPTAPRTSSSRCSATSCATRSRRS